VQCQGSVPFFKRRGSEIRSIPHHIFESTYCTFLSTECLHRYPSDTSISCAIHQRKHPSHSTLHSYPSPEPEPEPSSHSIAPTIIIQQNHRNSPEPSLLLTRTIITTHQNHYYYSSEPSLLTILLTNNVLSLYLFCVAVNLITFVFMLYYLITRSLFPTYLL